MLLWASASCTTRSRGPSNALIVDSSALAEQVAADVLSSAFDSAGQRCSALRLLCLQEDIADRILVMRPGGLRGEVPGATATEEKVMRRAAHDLPGGAPQAGQAHPGAGR